MHTHAYTYVIRTQVHPALPPLMLTHKVTHNIQQHLKVPLSLTFHHTHAHACIHIRHPHTGTSSLTAFDAHTQSNAQHSTTHETATVTHLSPHTCTRMHTHTSSAHRYTQP